MAALKQKASDSSYGHRPLPFKSREDVNHQLGSPAYRPPSSYWAPLNKGKEIKENSDKSHGPLFSSANKENVRSWLDSTSPRSVLISRFNQQYDDPHPSTPSPVCSPLASSLVSSPYLSMEQVPQADRASVTAANVQKDDKGLQAQPQSLGKNEEELPSTSRRHGKDILNEPPPDSPTGSNVSLGSEGGLLALLASKLLAYKENGRRFSRYARESSGPIDEKHVMEDRSKKPPVDEISLPYVDTHPQVQDSDANSSVRNGSLYRTASEAVSEFSLGSANGRTLSMEFDAMLAAAVATGIHQASTIEEPRHAPLPEIQEDSSFRGRTGANQHHDAISRALVRVNDIQASSDDEAGRMTRALTVMRQGHGSEDLDFNSPISEMPASSARSSVSNGSRRGEAEEQNNMQLVPTGLIQTETAEVSDLSARESSSCGSNGDQRLAMVLATHASDANESASSLSSSTSICKEKNMLPPLPLPASKALEKVRRDRIHAQALAYQDAKSSKCNNRYKREECKITAWENQQKIKAGVRMKKVEMRLEQKRAKAFERMQNEIAYAHKRAEERKASAEAVRASKTARVAQHTEVIRRTGKLPSSGVHVGCFPF